MSRVIAWCFNTGGIIKSMLAVRAVRAAIHSQLPANWTLPLMDQSASHKSADSSLTLNAPFPETHSSSQAPSLFALQIIVGGWL